MSTGDRVGDGVLRKLDSYLPRTISPWLVIAVLGVAFAVRSVLREYIGSIATPILFVCLSGVYWRQHQARQAKEAEEAAELDELQKAEIQAHLQRQKELEKLDRTHPRADSAAGAVVRGPALRSGDSFGGDIPQDRQRRFAGDTGTWSGPACIDEAAQARLRRRQQRRDVPRGGHAESKASGGGGKAESKQTLRHEWKVRTHQPAQTFRRDGSDEDNGAGAMGDTSFVTDKVSVADARAALRGGKTPAGGAASSRDSAAPLVPANVTVTEGGRRLYRGRTAEQLEKRRQRRAKAKAQAAKRRSVKRLTGVTSRTEDVAGDQSLHEMVASGHLSADGRPIRGVRGTGRGVSVGAAEAERRNNPSQGDRRERYGGSGSVAASQVGGGSVGVGSAPKHVPWGTVPEFLADVQLPQYAQAFQDEDMTDMGLLVGLAANSDRAALRSTLKELGVTKLGHFEKIVQRLAPYTA